MKHNYNKYDCVIRNYIKITESNLPKAYGHIKWQQLASLRAWKMWEIVSFFAQ